MAFDHRCGGEEHADFPEIIDMPGKEWDDDSTLINGWFNYWYRRWRMWWCGWCWDESDGDNDSDNEDEKIMSMFPYK